jgi:hypothetical protein
LELGRQIANEELARAESEADSASNALDLLNDQRPALEHERDTSGHESERVVEMQARRGQHEVALVDL